MTNAETIAEILDSARGITNYYLGKLASVDPLQQFTLNGATLNSPLWIAAHLAWAEHALVVGGMEAREMPFEWMKTFTLGSANVPTPEWPSMQEALDAMTSIHATTLDYIRSLSDEALEETITLGKIRWTDPRKKILYHVIRHEGTHAGHLGWICKLHGIATI
jgi:hypothetical protein